MIIRHDFINLNLYLPCLLSLIKKYIILINLKYLKFIIQYKGSIK